MSKVIVRPADVYDLPFLREEIAKQDVEQIDLTKSVTVVAECEGQPFTSLSASLAWLIEPTVVFNAEALSKMTIRRGMLLNYLALNKFIQTQIVRKQFCHIPVELKNSEWAKKLGFTKEWDRDCHWLSKE